MRAQQSSNAEAGAPVDPPQDVLAAAVLAVSRFAGQEDAGLATILDNVTPDGSNFLFNSPRLLCL